jgi:hypothetical protein
MRTLSLVTLALALALVVAAACGDPLGLPPPAVANRVDTLSLYALSGTPITSPSGYVIAFRAKVRTDQSVQGFDFAFDIDTAGRPVLLPTGALRLGRGSGIQLSTTPFDSILVAPNRAYQLDSAVVVDSNDVAILHSRPASCTFGITTLYYAKLHVIRIDTTTGPDGRRIDFEILSDVNCGYRGLEPGLPRR